MKEGGRRAHFGESANECILIGRKRGKITMAKSTSAKHKPLSRSELNDLVPKLDNFVSSLKPSEQRALARPFGAAAGSAKSQHAIQHFLDTKVGNLNPHTRLIVAGVAAGVAGVGTTAGVAAGVAGGVATKGGRGTTAGVATGVAGGASKAARGTAAGVASSGGRGTAAGVAAGVAGGGGGTAAGVAISPNPKGPAKKK
jgi:hypothetical protein